MQKIEKDLISRFERKWMFENCKIDLLKIPMFRSNFLFREIFEPRFVNSIYFDDSNFTSITQNLDGVKNKIKFRIRWYGKKEIIKKPQLEIKSKNGFTSSKKTIDLKIKEPIKFNFDGVNNLKQLALNYLGSKINLFPILSTHYYRHYFLSANKLIRATIDNDLNSSLLYGYTNYNFKRNFSKTVLEFKYNSNLDNYVRKNLINISARISRNSKYISSALFKPDYYSL